MPARGILRSFRLLQGDLSSWNGRRFAMDWVCHSHAILVVIPWFVLWTPVDWNAQLGYHGCLWVWGGGCLLLYNLGLVLSPVQRSTNSFPVLFNHGSTQSGCSSYRTRYPLLPPSTPHFALRLFRGCGQLPISLDGEVVAVDELCVWYRNNRLSSFL